MSWKYLSSLYLVWMAFFLDAAVYMVIIPIIPSYLHNLHVSQTAVGVLFASKGLAQVLSGPFWGWMVDVAGPRKPLFVASLILCGSTVAFALGDDYWFLLLARSVEGFSSGAAFSSGMAYLSLVFTDESERNSVMSWAQTGLAIGLISGAPFGGALYGLTGKKELPFFALAGLVALFAVTQLLIKDFAPKAADVESKSQESEDAKKEPYRGVARLLQDPQVWIVTIAFTLAAGLLTVIDPIFPLFFEEKFNVSALMTGIAMMLATGGYAVGTPIVAALAPRVGRPAMISLGMLMMSTALPASSLMPYMWLTMATMFVVGFSVSMIDAAALPYMSQLVEMRHSARYFGAMYSINDVANSIGSIIGPLLGSVLYDRLNYFLALYIIGAVGVLYSPVMVAFAVRPTPQASLIDVTLN